MFIKHGIYCKKILYPPDQTQHSRHQFKIHFSPENLDMLLNKYWDNDDLKMDIDNLSLSI